MPTHGRTYGDRSITHLLGGSGGAGGNYKAGGGGGGAIELVADGTGTITITSGAKITVNGGDTTDNNRGGGGGSGGSIRLQGGSIVNNGSLEARGVTAESDKDGGGGRISLVSDGDVTVGNTDVTGFQSGTVSVLGNNGVTALNFSSGILHFHTTDGTWRHSDGKHAADGVITAGSDSGVNYGISTHTFDSINLGSGVTVIIEGENALILKTRSSGDIIVGTNLNVNGGNALTTENPWGGWLSTFTGGKGKAGGHEGGYRLGDGFGPGKGKDRVLNNDGGGAGYGSEGQQSDSASYGLTYGSESLTHLHGGSGGGGGNNVGGGAGGGAISLEADGNGTITINSGVTISANGGTSSHGNAGGGGSGGSIRFAGKSIVNNGSILAKGGEVTSGYAGGGGRVAFNYSFNLTDGTIDVGDGTIAENTAPILVGDLNATGYYSNANYPAQLTRASDLLGRWNFDDGTANDSSGNNHHGVASASDIYVTDTPTGSGKAVNLNGNKYITVSDGGNQSTFDGGSQIAISVWVKEMPDGDWDPWISKRGEGGQGWQLRRRNGIGYISWCLRGPGNDDWYVGAGSVGNGDWHHLAVNWGGGKRNIYIDGAKAGEENRGGNINATGSQLVFGARDNSGNAGNNPSIGNHGNTFLDDIRIYNSPLTGTEIAAIYAGDAGGAMPSMLHTLSALKGPTGFTATGLPSGLSVNSAGLISGVTTAVGDHNVTITANNLAGASTPQVYVLTIRPNVPVISDVNSSNIGGTSAVANFDLIENGGEDATITFFYGDNDGNVTVATGIPTSP